MRCALHDEGLVDDERRVLEPGFDVTELPGVGRIAEREPSSLDFFPVFGGPFKGLNLGAEIDIALEPGVGTARAEAFERIDAKGGSEQPL